MVVEVSLLLALGVLAVGCTVLLPFSLRPGIVTGPPWLGAVVVGGLLVPLVVAGLLALAAAPVPGPAQVVAVGALLVAAATGGSPMATGVLRLADPAAARAAEGVDLHRGGSSALTTRGTGPGAVSPARPVAATMSAPGLLRGGSTLGVLERLATFATLAAGSPEGIAVVLAVKGLGRFGELKIPAAPERFMIGTFASVLWACGCWAVTLAVLT